MSYEPPCFIEESDQAEINSGACAILNTTAIRDKFQLINKRFNLLFAKRAFVHWYVGQGRVKVGEDDDYVTTVRAINRAHFVKKSSSLTHQKDLNMKHFMRIYGSWNKITLII